MRTNALLVLVVLVLAALVSRPLLTGWQLWGHSSTIDYARLLEFDHVVRQGEVYPRWSPDFYYGYGSPLFNFYAPLPYWIGELFALGGMSILYSVKMMYLFAIVLAGVGMYLFARKLWGAFGGTAAAVLYLFAPYLLLDVYVRASAGETLCFAWLPFALYFLQRGLEGSRFSVVVAAFFTAALITTHNIIGLLSFAAIVLFVGVQTIQARDRTALLRGLTACALALGLSAFFWLPALAEKKWVFANEVLITEDYWYGNHFIGLRALFEPRWGFGTSEPGDSISLQLGIPHWVLTALAALTLTRVARLRGAHATYLWVLFGGAIFFTLPVSKPVWDLIPLLQFTQFPWRFLLFAAFASSAVAGAVFADLERRYPKWRFFSLGALIAAVLLVYGPYVHPRFVAADTTTRETRTLEKHELAAALSDPELIPIEEFLTLENMRRIGMRATILDDFLPIWVSTKPAVLPSGNHEVLEGAVAVETVEERAVERTYRLKSWAGGRVEFFSFWFPGWIGELDGRAIDLFPQTPSGCLSVEVPRGEHALRIRFVNTPIRTAAELLSLVSLASAAVLVAFRRRGFSPKD